VRANLGTLSEDLAALRKQIAGDGAQSGARARLAEMEALAAECIDGVQRTVGIVRELREFSRAGQEDRVATDVNVAVENAIRLAATHRGAGEEIALRAGQVPLVLGAPGQLRQLFLNVLLNALRAAGGGITVSSELDGEAVCVRVHGAGLAPGHDARGHLFGTSALGSGPSAEPSLGLHVSEQIARSHGGQLRVISDPERGTSFEVRLPMAPPAAA
jgi:signal transduction histidine kinase